MENIKMPQRRPNQKMTTLERLPLNSFESHTIKVESSWTHNYAGTNRSTEKRDPLLSSSGLPVVLSSARELPPGLLTPLQPAPPQAVSLA